ncbi:MAG: polyribonucleotide nucleotidyltransferase [Candidatus Gracilibacteria bacterium]|nr:polyribonucleotide nucleotidyltransferase [Candidatus Gracilibacteria bacterium]
MIGLSDKTAPNVKSLKKTYSIGGKNISFEAGKLALLINGAVTISDESGNVLLVTAGVKEEGVNGKADFFPLVVDYQERFYATGKIGGNRFQRREGRPSEAATLTSRLIDRPIRPMFPKGFINDTQIIAMALSSSGVSDLGFFGITGASLALMMTGAPFEGPVAGVRVIQTPAGEFIFDPNFEEEKTARLNILVAGTLDAITMVESAGKEVSVDEMISILEFSHKVIKELCNAEIDFIAEYKAAYGIPEVKAFYNKVDESLYGRVKAFLTEEKLETLYNKGKKEFHDNLVKLEEETKEFLGMEASESAIKEVCSIEEACVAGIEIDEGSIAELVYKRVKEVMRKNVLENSRRLDGRALDEVRQIKGEVGLLPRTHGSALFQRGMTQALSIATLGGPGDVQTVDDMYEETTRRYIHHYNFPPFSVGEVRMLRGIGRREIGHGKLAERALENMIPSEEEFPYVIRVVSETMTCNGSSSMASVCGSTMSLMNAGVPIKAPVAGIAMGMVYDDATGKYKILSDIQAQEDFLGDMDFKVTMTPNGVTAMQLDVKIKGLSMQVFKEAFAQARISINYILEEMLKVIPETNKELSPYAPAIIAFRIDIDKIRAVIGKGGENIQGLEKNYKVDIHIEDDGLVTITAPDQISGKKVEELIKAQIWEPEVGYTGIGVIAKIIEGTGAIVEFNGKSGMIHISKLAPTRVVNVIDVVKEGEKVEFEVIAVDKEKGRIGLKKKFEALPVNTEAPKFSLENTGI